MSHAACALACGDVPPTRFAVAEDKHVRRNASTQGDRCQRFLTDLLHDGDVNRACYGFTAGLHQGDVVIKGFLARVSAWQLSLTLEHELSGFPA